MLGSAHSVFEHREPSRVAARPCQARDEAGADRVDHNDEQDRHGSGRLQQRCHGCGAAASDEDVGRERRQFGRVPAKVVGIGRGPARVDPHLATVDPAPQRLMERLNAGLKFRIVRGRGHQHADPPHALGLLRAHGERPRNGCAA
jgi:hypothetical protein